MCLLHLTININITPSNVPPLFGHSLWACSLLDAGGVYKLRRMPFWLHPCKGLKKGKVMFPRSTTPVPLPTSGWGLKVEIFKGESLHYCLHTLQLRELDDRQRVRLLPTAHTFLPIAMLCCTIRILPETRWERTTSLGVRHTPHTHHKSCGVERAQTSENSP